jgi:nitrite reductase/ring-hydroxylating ferredoxin subunit
MTKRLKKSKRMPSPPVPPSSRRAFLNRLWAGLGILALAEIVWVVFSFVRPRKAAVKTGGFGARLACGPVEGFEKASVTAFARGHFYLSRLADGGFLALSRQCTHLGCTVPWDGEEKKFVCPCHASAFDITGNVLSAPATRALDLFTVDIENNMVRVDTGHRIKRSGFRREQVVYPNADSKKNA